MYKQPTPEEYDAAFLEAKRDLAIRGIDLDDDDSADEGREFITTEDFFSDLKRVSRPLRGIKSPPKPSET